MCQNEDLECLRSGDGPWLVLALSVDSVEVCDYCRVDEGDRDGNSWREQGVVEGRIDGERVCNR